MNGPGCGHNVFVTLHSTALSTTKSHHAPRAAATPRTTASAVLPSACTEGFRTPQTGDVRRWREHLAAHVSAQEAARRVYPPPPVWPRSRQLLVGTRQGDPHHSTPVSPVPRFPSLRPAPARSTPRGRIPLQPSRGYSGQGMHRACRTVERPPSWPSRIRKAVETPCQPRRSSQQQGK